ncbi:MAG: DUF4468 domain-containing protein [Bacteroidota bacterium]
MINRIKIKTIRSLLAFFLVVVAQYSFAQVQDPTSPGYDYGSTDSTTQTPESTTDSSAQTGAKPYERIVLEIDSNTNLITYGAVVEQEESGSDSLYTRAKKFAEKVFGKDKSIFEVQKNGQKLVMNASIPAYSYANKFNKRLIGKYEFKMTVLVKEGRYKYTITNLVHQGNQPNIGKPFRNYFEYYYNSTINVKMYDTILRYADREIKETMVRFQTSMKEPKLIDEDEW